MKCIQIILCVIFELVLYSEQGVIFDKILRQSSHDHNGNCGLCASLIKDRCNTGVPGQDTLCRRIASQSCPTQMYRPKPYGFLQFTQGGINSIGSSEEFELLTAKKEAERKLDKNVMDLLSGILTAAHSSTKADMKRAKLKEIA